MCFWIVHTFGMPSKNAIKKYVAGGYYHVYNRGVEKRSIFIDDQDYRTFLNILKIVLTPKEDLDNTDFINITNKADSLELVAYCLMPNHFHFIIKQFDETAMSEFMKIIMTAYVPYFNKRYKRVGSLFQGRYKAVLIERDEYLSHLSRYIHINPLEENNALKEYPYSSYKYYLSDSHPKWLNPLIVKSMFTNTKEYERFIKDQKIDSMKFVRGLSID